MQSAAIVARQVLIMFFLAMVGFFSRKTNILTESAARSFSSLLLNVALPCAMISSVYRPRQEELLPGFLLVFVLGVLLHAGAILVSRLFIKSAEEDRRTERFALVYPNSVYMAMPLISATVGEDGTFFVAAFVAVFLLFHWTHGVAELGGAGGILKIVKNPGIISVFLGMFLFWFEIPVFAPLMDTVSILGGLTTPVSMIITGVFLSDVKLEELKNARIYLVSLLRVVAMPAIALAVFSFFGIANLFYGAREACLVALYCFSCPSAVSVILLSATLGRDVRHPSKLVAVSTLISLITLPCIAWLAEIFLH